jgi:hypothetical protein
VRGFENQLDICFEQDELSPSELKRTEELVIEKYDHAAWTERS